jgi:hypothetical protein
MAAASLRHAMAFGRWASLRVIGDCASQFQQLLILSRGAAVGFVPDAVRSSARLPTRRPQGPHGDLFAMTVT